MNNVHLFYIGVTSITALACFYAAFLDFTGSEAVKAIADRLGVPRAFMIPFGMLLTAGGIGLLAGWMIPLMGEAAAIGLVIYFICAIGAHLRVRDLKIGGAVTFLILALSCLFLNVTYYGSLR